MTLTSSGSTGNSALLTNTSFNFTPTQALGDLFVVHMNLGDSGATISAPSGWSTGYNGGGPEAGSQVAVFYKTFFATESTPITFSWTGVSTSYVYGYGRWTSNQRSRYVQLTGFSSGSTATDNAANYVTPTITASNQWIAYGIGS